MTEFYHAVVHYEFLRNALLAGILASIACGMTGSFVVIKRMTYVSGGIAHAVFGGVGIAYFLGINPLLGALAFSIAAAFLLGYVKLKLKQKEDTLISTFWSMGMAVGIIFIHLTPGYSVNLLSFLFGNILMVSQDDLKVLLLLDVIIFSLIFIFYRRLMYVCFDEEYTTVRGYSIEFLYLLLLCIISLTVVVVMQVVGLILVIALLTLPASIAELFSNRLSKMMRLAVLFGMIFTLWGLYFSYRYNFPSGATVIVITGFGYIAALILQKCFGFINKSITTARR